MPVQNIYLKQEAYDLLRKQENASAYVSSLIIEDAKRKQMKVEHLDLEKKRELLIKMQQYKEAEQNLKNMEREIDSYVQG